MLFQKPKVYFDNSLEFYVNNQLHKLDGPASIIYDDFYGIDIISIEYQRRGRLHEAYKPAEKEWDYIDDVNDICQIYTLSYVKYYIYGINHRLRAACISWYSYMTKDEIFVYMDELKRFSSSMVFKLDGNPINTLNKYIKIMNSIRSRLNEFTSKFNKSFIRKTPNEHIKSVNYVYNDLKHRYNGPASIKWNKDKYFRNCIHSRSYSLKPSVVDDSYMDDSYMDDSYMDESDDSVNTGTKNIEYYNYGTLLKVIKKWDDV